MERRTRHWVKTSFPPKLPFRTLSVHFVLLKIGSPCTYLVYFSIVDCVALIT